MFIFIDESGSTDLHSKQRFLVVAFAIMKNRDFSEQLIFEIKDKCKQKGKPIVKKEVKYHNLDSFQREIAVQILNSRYKKFYVCFFDVEKAPPSFVTGKSETIIQKEMIHNLLISLDRSELNEFAEIKIIMDKKLSKSFQDAIRDELQKHLNHKKGIFVESSGSSRERGIQVADLIAGAFRAKLMKKSDLFEVELQKVFQITIKDDGAYKAEKLK